MTCKVHAEIEYVDENGDSVHSDICPPNCSADSMKEKEYREFLHKSLDEWLDKSNGTGMFCISNEAALMA